MERGKRQTADGWLRRRPTIIRRRFPFQRQRPRRPRRIQAL